MKLPRWLLACLLGAALAAIGAFLFLWVTAPDRRARDFLARVAAEKFESANELFERPARWVRLNEDYLLFTTDGGRYWNLPATMWQAWLAPERIVYEPRSLTDVVRGERRFHRVDGACQFVARRHSVGVAVPDEKKLAVEMGQFDRLTYRLRNMEATTAEAKLLRRQIDAIEASAGTSPLSIPQQQRLAELHARLERFESERQAVKSLVGRAVTRP